MFAGHYLLLLDAGGGSSSAPAATWVPNPYAQSGGVLDAGTCRKSVGDSDFYGMDWGNFPQPQSGQTMTAFTLTSSGLTVSGVTSVNNYLVTALFSGGASGQTYPVTGTVTWSGGTVTSRVGTMAVD